MKTSFTSNNIFTVVLATFILVFCSCEKQIPSHDVTGKVLNVYTHEPITNSTVIINEQAFLRSSNKTRRIKEKERICVNERGEFTLNAKNYANANKDIAYYISVQDKITSAWYYPNNTEQRLNVKDKNEKNQTFYVYPSAGFYLVVDSVTAINKDIKTITLLTKYEAKELTKIAGNNGAYWYYGGVTFVDPGQNDIKYRYTTNAGVVSLDYQTTQSFITGKQQIQLNF